MTPYLFIFLSMLFFSIGIFIDNFLINKRFKDTKSLLFYSNITNLLFIPLLWIFGMPKMLPTDLIIPLVVVGIAQIIYLYPYYKALKVADTSIISALFNLGKIFTPVLAYVIVNERLSPIQYAGFAIIIFASFMLTYEGGLKVNKALLYMMLTTLILAISSTVTKYSLGEVDWITVMTWSAVFSTIITIVVGLIFYRRHIAKSGKNYFRSFWQFMINEFVTFIAMACLIYAIVDIPVTIAQGLLATSPVLMIALTFFGRRLWPSYFKENLQWKYIIRKSVYFIIIAIGIVMSVR